jgi:hypothetical protein
MSTRVFDEGFMTDLEAAVEYARAIVEAPSRSMAKRLAMVHETALATQLLATVERAEKMTMAANDLQLQVHSRELQLAEAQAQIDYQVGCFIKAKDEANDLRCQLDEARARIAALEALIKEKDVRLRVIANGSHRLIFKDTSDEAFRREAGALASDALAFTPNSIQSRAQAQAQAQAQARVIEAAKEVLWIDECRCDDAWTKRGMHEPNALCSEMKPLRDALAELERT